MSLKRSQHFRMETALSDSQEKSSKRLSLVNPEMKPVVGAFAL
jgi:hypothetical protein